MTLRSDGHESERSACWCGHAHWHALPHTLTCVLLHVIKAPLKVDRDISLQPPPAFSRGS